MSVAVTPTKPEPVLDRPGRKVADDSLAIRTDGLTKSFGPQVVVDHVDLAVPTGAVYGFLGPNGSGKTTTIRMLLGLVAPSSGSVTLLGESQPGAADALRRTGALVEGPAFHPYLSGTANLARLDAVDLAADPRTSAHRIHAALERVGLTAAAGKRFRQYSLGMKQRLAIAAALLAPRDLLVLDEPTNGLDPQGTREVRTLVAQLAADGATVLVSSHLLAEIEQICSHLGVISDGRLVAQGTVDEVKHIDLGSDGTVTSTRPLVVVRTMDAEAAAQVLAALGATEVVTTTGSVTARLISEAAGDDGVQPEDVVKALVAAGVGVRGFEVVRPTLEDVFVGLTGEGFDVRH